MIKKAGPPVYAKEWWLVPVSGAEVSSNAEPHDLTAGLQGVTSPVPALDADLIFAAFPFPSSRKLRHSSSANGTLGLVAVRVVTMNQRRHELEHVIALRERAGRIEALFGDPAPSSDARRQICEALGECLQSALGHGVPGHDFGIAPSKWSTEELLALLHAYPRLDDGVDQLAFRVGSRSSHRAVYVFLYGSDPTRIHFDLEDLAAEADQWDGTVARGSVTTAERMVLVAREWLDKGGLYVDLSAPREAGRQIDEPS